MNKINQENISKLSNNTEKLEFAQNKTTFSDVNSLKEYIHNLNQTYFNGKSSGLYWRKDKDENMSLRTKDRYAKKGDVGLNIDFNLIKKSKNINSDNLEINILVRNKELSEAIKNNGFNIQRPYEVRSRYTKTTMPGEYHGDVLIKDIESFKKMMETCSEII